MGVLLHVRLCVSNLINFFGLFRGGLDQSDRGCYGVGVREMRVGCRTRDRSTRTSTQDPHVVTKRDRGLGVASPPGRGRSNVQGGHGGWECARVEVECKICRYDIAPRARSRRVPDDGGSPGQIRRSSPGTPQGKVVTVALATPSHRGQRLSIMATSPSVEESTDSRSPLLAELDELFASDPDIDEYGLMPGMEPESFVLAAHKLAVSTARVTLNPTPTLALSLTLTLEHSLAVSTARVTP